MTAAGDWYQRGLADGEAWARATGTTSADLHMVPVVQGSKDYKRGHRVGVSIVRRERYLAENTRNCEQDGHVVGCQHDYPGDGVNEVTGIANND